MTVPRCCSHVSEHAELADKRNGPGTGVGGMGVMDTVGAMAPLVPPHRPLPGPMATAIPAGHNMIVTLQRTTDDIML